MEIKSSILFFNINDVIKMKIVENRKGRPKLILIPPVREARRKCHHPLIHKYLTELDRMVKDGCNKEEIKFLIKLHSRRCRELESKKDKTKKEWNLLKEYRTLILACWSCVSYAEWIQRTKKTYYFRNKYSYEEKIANAQNTLKHYSGNKWRMYISSNEASFHFTRCDLDLLIPSGGIIIEMDYNELGLKPGDYRKRYMKY